MIMALMIPRIIAWFLLTHSHRAHLLPSDMVAKRENISCAINMQLIPSTQIWSQDKQTDEKTNNVAQALEFRILFSSLFLFF